MCVGVRPFFRKGLAGGGIAWFVLWEFAMESDG
jgi:hypothetical protein